MLLKQRKQAVRFRPALVTLGEHQNPESQKSVTTQIPGSILEFPIQEGMGRA